MQAARCRPATSCWRRQAAGNYQTLQTKLEELLASGVSYTTPTTGENRSSVQLVDLDGDGAEEAIVFFRGATSATSNDFKVYIYKKNGDDYRCTGSIEAKGAAIQSVEYPTITPVGRPRHRGHMGAGRQRNGRADDVRL